MFNGKEFGGGESAERYLYAIGEPERAEDIKTFKEELKNLVVFYPYYFQELSGLSNIHSSNPKDAYDSERTLTIKTLESIDLRMGRVIEKYTHAYFDHFERRQLIPENLLNFRLYIIISEVRQFRTFVQKAMANVDDLNMVELSSHLNAYMYEFYPCKFNFQESHPFLSTMKMDNPDMAHESFKIEVGRLKATNKLDFIDMFKNVDNSGIFGKKPTLATNPTDKRIGKAQWDMAKTVATDVKEYSKNQADQFLQSNDPRNVAGRVFRSEIMDRVDKEVKTIMNKSIASVRSSADDIKNAVNPTPDRSVEWQTNEAGPVILNQTTDLGIAPGVIGAPNPKPGGGGIGTITVNDITIKSIRDLGIDNVAGVSLKAMTDLGAVTVGDVGKKLELISSNVFGFESDPIKSILESMIKANLGSILMQSPSVKVTDLGSVKV